MQDFGISEVVAIATALQVASAAAIVRLYRDKTRERARADALSEQLNKEHKRDLRHVAGLPTSLQPHAPQPEPFTTTELFSVRDLRRTPPGPVWKSKELSSVDGEEEPPPTERPPPRKPPRPRR